MRLLFVVCLFFIAVSGCASLGDKDDGDLGAKELYDKGKKALNKGDYEMAIQSFEKLESRYPFRVYAQHAKLDIAYAYYKFGEPESAISAADRFIKTYPRHPNVDYAYYIRGVASFPPEKSFFDKLFRLDPAHRDPRTAEKSFQYFSELVDKFPQSTYHNDAVQRMIFLENYLARHELYVANYYMKRKAYVAALNRAEYIIGNYSRARSVPDALAMMLKAYQKLGLDDLAADTEKIIEFNYPNGLPANIEFTGFDS